MKRTRLLLAALLVAAALPANATNGMRMIGFGSVQNSMGGVGVGATLDSAAIVTNPAGMSDLEPRLDFDIGLFVPKPSYNATGAPVPPGNPAFVQSPGQRFETNRGPSPIPFVGAILPLSPDLKLGLSLSAVAGMGVDYAANLYSGRTNTSYMQARLTPAIAYKLGDVISVGAGVNLMVALMDWDVASGFGQQPHDRATSLGVGGVVGVKVKPDPMISFGAAYETPSWFRDFSFDIPAHPNPMDGGATTIPAAQDKLTFNQPMTATFGVALTPFAGMDEGPLVIGADVEWINWSWSNGLNKPAYTADSIDPSTGVTKAGSMPWNMNWSDQWVFKIGAQIAATRSLKVRVGYNYGKNPLDPSRAFENLAFPAVQEHHFTAGLGITATDKLAINLGGMYAPTSSISGSNGNYPAPMNPPGTQPGQGITGYSTRMYQWQVDAGIAYKF